jgi:hypothetical protein
MTKPCCGQAVRRRRGPVRPALPPNPKISRGVRLIYIGAGQKTIKGRISKLKYYLSDHRRHFTADPRDADDILKSRYFMLQP